MADNVVANAGTGGATFATDDVSGVHYPITKLAHGALDSVSLVSSSNGLPVAQQGAWSVGVSGTVTVSISGTCDTELPSAVALSDTLANPTAPLVGSCLVGWDGTQWRRAKIDATNGIAVEVKAIPNVTIASGTVTLSSNVIDTELAAAASLSDALANPTTAPVGALAMGWDGTNWRRLKASAANGLEVEVKALPSVTVGAALPTGSNNIGDVDVLTLPGIAGTVAHDAGDSGNPIKMGARAIAAEIAAVGSGDRSDLLTDLVGKLITRPHCNPENQVSGVASSASTSDTAVLGAAGEGVRNYVTSISLANAAASTNTIVEIKSGATVLWRSAAPATGGSNICFDPPLRGGLNEAINFACLTAATTVYFAANGYKGA